ncbi:MAG TPA: AAA domain-containing protein, partial [Burkholderiales bacterium]|nr:AAA domain-containing protein [Burkholderiales bacterium]
MDIQQRRLLSLVDYAQQTLRTRSRPVSNVAEHGSFLLFDHQAAAIEGLVLDSTGPDGNDEIWLSVPKPEAPGVPPESDDPWLAPWLSVGIAMPAEPRLAAEVDGADLIAAGTHRDAAQAAGSVAEAAEPAIDAHARVRLADYPFRGQVEARYADYLEKTWRPWAQGEQRRRHLAHLYVRLFTLRQEMAGALGDGQLELAWGIGIASAGPAGPGHPLVTRQVDLAFDPDTQAAEIRPRDLDPRLELEAFAPADKPGLAEAERAADDYLARATESVSPFAPHTVEPLLAIARDFLGDAIRDTPRAWVLFARPRGSGLALQDLEHFREGLARGRIDRLPGAVAALVTEPSQAPEAVELPRYRGVSAAYDDRSVVDLETAEDLFFPKPFNDEQAHIVQVLEAADGVVVQGPPGTGKTHTIANIICHYLANGRRVLVTSMRDPALEVLREHLPAGLRPLAVSLVAGAEDATQQLERSIRKIATEVQSLDRQVLESEVERSLESIEAFHARLKRIDTDLGRWARLNLARIEMEGESLDPLDAANEVVQQAGRFEWIPDALGVGSQYAPQFDAEDLARFREARRQLGVDIAQAGCLLPDPAALPDTVRLVLAHDELRRYARLMKETRSREFPALAQAGGAEAITRARELTGQIARLKAAREDLAASGLPWSEETLVRIKRGEPRPMVEVFEKLVSELEQLGQQRVEGLTRPILVADGMEYDPAFQQAVDKLAEGRRPFAFSLFAKPAVRDRIASVRIAGAPPVVPADWQLVRNHLARLRKRRELTARWNAMAPELGLQTVLAADAIGRLSADSQILLYRKVRALAEDEAALSANALRLLPSWPRAAQAGQDADALRELESILAHHLNRFQLGEVSQVLEDLRKGLEGRRGEVVDRMRDFIGSTLGNPAVEEPTLLSHWSTLLAEMERLRALAPMLEVVGKVTAAIARSGAPKLAAALQAGLVAEDKLLPEGMLGAWRLKRLAGHLQAIDAREEFRKLSAMRSSLEHDLARAYDDLVVRRTWLKLVEQATPGVRAALQAYLNAIQRLGKGTGKRAFRYRRDARNAAAEAHRAVPCWIMPHYRVSESLPAELGCFDLVVIDEASQSDISALPVLLRAKKLLVVGDDRQVSPQAIGVEEDRIRALMQRHLQEQVPLYAAQMSPDRSIYDLAKVVFAHSGVMLKEHFRCVAPIIEYSRREFYAHELRPMRLARLSERLDPPLIDYVIENGRREGGINLAEVEFIVGEIKAMTADPRLQHRTLGVVSLLGEEQALKAWERLTEELGPELMRRHAIVCGDARLFQGRERDVMFLSMVCAPNDVGAPLSREAFAQRFNVAGSRARDRMVLVRSVDLHHLPESDRLRRALILHFQRPFGEEPARVPDLRQVCESQLERDLFEWLNGEGYRVTPQVAVGAYRIDLVVEGADDARLAIECDGDKGQGPAQWVEDMRRQRALERVGWVFWRCFATA